MNKMEYANAIAEKIESAVVREIEKANGIRVLGVTVTNRNVSPCVYIDDAYDAGISVDDMVAKINDLLSGDMPQFDVIWITDYSEVAPKLVARLYNAKTKADVFMSAEKYGFNDLIIVPYINIGNDGWVKVNKALIEKWGVSESKVISDAIENSAKDMDSGDMEKILEELSGGSFINLPIPMLVVTNKTRLYGAISIIYQRDFLDMLYPDGYTVIPSSVHEIIVLPGRMEGIDDMVKEVNATEVLPVDILSDHVYVF